MINADEIVSIFWNCISGTTYRVYYCGGLGPATTWLIAEGNIVPGITGKYEWVDDGTYTGTSPANVLRKFYQVMICDPCNN